jgi:VanZ family protein
MTAPAGTPGVRRAWGVVILWLAFQLSLTSLPGSVLPDLPGTFRIDWVAHFCMYFGLAFLIARVWRMSGRRTALLLLVWFGIGAFGAFDEWHETFIPGRGAELMDWLMDMSGSAAGFTAGILLMRHQWAARLLR